MLERDDGRTVRFSACCQDEQSVRCIPVPPFNEAYPTGPALCRGTKAPAKAAKGERTLKAKLDSFIATGVRLVGVVNGGEL
jgi:hypothetical protein